MNVVEEVKKDLVGWKLGRVISVCDRGFVSDDNLRYLQRSGGHYIVGEKLRPAKKEVQEAMSRAGRYQQVDEKLHVKEIVVGDGEARKRYVLAYNPEEAKRRKIQWDKIVSTIEERLKELKQLPDGQHTKAMCALRSHSVYGCYIRQLKDGRLKLDKGKIKEDSKYDGKYLLRTSDDTLEPQDVALGYKQLLEVEDAFRTIKQELEIRPIYHRLDERIRAHVVLGWLALLLVRIAENATDDTWRNIRRELENIHVREFLSNSGEVHQRTELTPRQRQIFDQIGIQKPPKYLEIDTKA